MGNFLFASPSFLSGMARAFDLGATFDRYNLSRTPQLADERALYNDWLAVGNALWSSREALLADVPHGCQLPPELKSRVEEEPA